MRICATRMFLSDSIGTNSNTYQVRVPDFVRAGPQGLTQIRVGFYNGRIVVPGQTGETGSGQTMTLYGLALEYPFGSAATRMTFSGSNTATVASGAVVLSDPLALNIPDGSKIAYSFRIGSSGAIPYADQLSWTAGGEKFNITSTDYTMEPWNTDFVDAGWNLCIYPFIVLGDSTLPAFVLNGDSICRGYHGGFSSIGARGVLRKLAEKFPVANWGVNSQRLADYLSSHTLRQQYANQYADYTVNELLINDIASWGLNRTAAQEIADILSAKALATNKFIQTTCTPSTPTSTGSTGWSSTANPPIDQVKDANNSARLTVNNNTRAATGIDGYIEVANSLEIFGQDGGYFVAGPGNQYTTDGIHPSEAGYQLVDFSLDQFARTWTGDATYGACETQPASLENWIRAPSTWIDGTSGAAETLPASAESFVPGSRTWTDGTYAAAEAQPASTQSFVAVDGTVAAAEVLASSAENWTAGNSIWSDTTTGALEAQATSTQSFIAVDASYSAVEVRPTSTENWTAGVSVWTDGSYSALDAQATSHESFAYVDGTHSAAEVRPASVENWISGVGLWSDATYSAAELQPASFESWASQHVTWIDVSSVSIEASAASVYSDPRLVGYLASRHTIARDGFAAFAHVKVVPESVYSASGPCRFTINLSKWLSSELFELALDSTIELTVTSGQQSVLVVDPPVLTTNNTQRFVCWSMWPRREDSIRGNIWLRASDNEPLCVTWALEVTD